MRRWATIPIFILAILFLGPLVAHGQGETTASIRGQVSAADRGETLPGANVVAVHVPSGTKYGTSANASGRYTLANLRVGGPYRITVSFVGYQSKREEGVTLELGETQRIDFALREKTEALDEVEVVARSAGVLSSGQQGVSTKITGADLEQQPTLGRSIADVARLSPQAYVVNSNDDGPAISIAGQWNRFNSIYIDGAVTNDVFGLSAQGTPGGQSGAAPVSLSAVEAMSVDVAPFDVTKSGFTGGAINFVTKSGTNEFEGSFEYYRRDDALTQSTLEKDGEAVLSDLPDASDDRYVFTLGGPIIKDELFFFVNADIRRKSDGLPLQGGYDGTTPLRGGDNPNDLESVFEIRDFVETNTGYDPGTPGDKSTILDSEKFLGRLDYNLSENHRLTARYWYNDNYNIDRFQSTRGEINFQNNSEVFPSKQHNAMLQWRGNFGTSVATKTTATYQTVEDDRGVEGQPFPAVTIEETGGDIVLGSEPFSYPNFLEQDVGTLTNETDIFLGDHTLTVGAHGEFYSIDNRFAIFGPGDYSFDSLDDFEQTVCHFAYNRQNQEPGDICRANYTADVKPATGSVLHQYSLLDDNPETDAFEAPGTDDTNLRSDFNATKIGVFVQDEWQATDQLRLTLGLRADFPKILDDPQSHPTANTETIPAIKDAGYDLNGAQAGQMPDWRAFLSPRFGFDYALDTDRDMQVRGGTGVFTSRLPFVWPGGAYLNDGVSAGFFFGTGEDAPLRLPGNGLTAFDTNPDLESVDALTPTGNLILFRDDFSYPRVWRSSLAFDSELAAGFTGSIEGQFSSKLQDVIVQNVNIKQSNTRMEGPETDDRPLWQASKYEDGSITIDDSYGDIFLLDNTDKGYSYTVTASLRKEATPVWDGGSVRGRFSYTYGDSRSKNQFGDTVGSNWDDNPHAEGTNTLELGRSPYSLGHKVQLSMAYRQEITENVATNLSFYYTGQSGRPFSYTIGGGANEDMIGDQGGAPLFYVPNDVDNMTFAPIKKDGTTVRTVAQQKEDLRTFINNVDYLSENRGGYATRNGDRTPFESVVDLKFALDFTGEVVGRNQRLSLMVDIFNFSSLLGTAFDEAGFGFGKTWGRRYQQVGTYSPVDFDSFQDSDGNGRPTPVYQSNLGTDDPAESVEEAFDLESGTQTYSSLYQVRLGLKYTF